MRVRLGVWTLMLVSLVAACLDDGPTVIDPERPATLVLSDTAAPTSSLSTARASLSDSTSFASGATYVSLAAGTIPNAMIAVIRNRRTERSVTAPMTNGGLDPVRVAAAPGDTLETTVEVSGVAATTFVNMVPARRRPTVVRTIPARRKSDVPLNARITIVFSEPIDSRTISSMSVRLVRGSTSVPVQMNVADGAGLSVELTPGAPLAVGTTYQIVVSQDVRDLDGDELEMPFASEFTTGSAVAVASIATAQTALFTAPSNGELRTFEMSAMLDENGSVSGRFSIFYPGTGGRVAGRVTCFAIADGRAAWVAGVVDDAGNPEGIGYAMGWRVLDNGHPDSGVADQLSFAHPIGQGQEFGAEFCGSTPTIDKNNEEISLYELLSGNVVVAGPGDPPPPVPPTSGMSRIAFAAFPNGGIRVMRADGLGVQALTNTTDWNPTWSPDGSKIAFQRNSTSDSRADIFSMNADGSGLRALTSGDAFDGNPAWSPDGQKIAFYRDGAIYMMRASDGSGLTKLTDNGGHPSWSPDGLHIAFWGGNEEGHRVVFVMNADGSGRTQLTHDSLGASTPSWSPDGLSIAFQGEHGIHVMNADGSNVTRVALGGQTPAWSPDNKSIIYEWFGLNVISTDGSAMTRRGTGFTPAWSPMGTVPPVPQPSVTIQLAGGDAQADTVLATLAQPLSVRLVRDDGTPASGVRVSWRLDGSGAAVRPSLATGFSVTDASGLAAVGLKLGSATGPVMVYALVSDGTAGSLGVAFRAMTTAGTPVKLVRYGVDTLLATVNSPLAYSVFALDGHGPCPTCGNHVSGLPISWTVSAGGGTVTPLDTTAMDSGSGYPLSQAVHQLGPNEGTFTVTATASTVAPALQITFTTMVFTGLVEVQWGGFLPDTVIVSSGKTVAWRWNPGGDSDDVHSVVFEDDPTEPVSSPAYLYGLHKRTFDGSARTIRYRCPLHSSGFAEGEVGVVVVR